MEPISTYDIPVTEQLIMEGKSRNEYVRIFDGPYAPEPIELAFEEFFRNEANTPQYVDYTPQGYKEVDIKEVSIFINNPNRYFRNEKDTIKIVADESVIEWVKKFYNTKSRERADNIPPITIRATINHRTGEGVMTICEYNNTPRPIGF